MKELINIPPQWMGTHIHHNGEQVSPAQLVSQLAGCTRNAWKHIWLLLPGETRWQLAEPLRR
jgi:hypothetical protein